MLTPHEIEFWSSKYKGPPHIISYAHKQAVEYAEQHAAGMIEQVRHGVCLAAFRYQLEYDVGERKLLRIAIDALLDLGRAANGHASA